MNHGISNKQAVITERNPGNKQFIEKKAKPECNAAKEKERKKEK